MFRFRFANRFRSFPGLLIFALHTPILMLTFTLTASPARATQYLIKPDGTGLFATIQDAIDVAADGDEIVLADGVFRGAGNRDLDFGGKAVCLRSQFGERDACVLDLEGAPGETHRAFYFHSGETSATRVESITVRGGLASDPGWPNGYGGVALCVDESAPTFVDCVFEANGAQVAGGAIACRDSSPRLVDCRLQNNSAPYGGAFYTDRPCLLIYPSDWVDPPPTPFERCELLGNSSEDGGAIYARGIHTFLDMNRCTLRDNVADRGGALRVHGALARIDSCWVERNVAHEDGGGFAVESTIFCEPGSGTEPASVQISNSSFLGNVAAFGGAISVFSYDVSISCCTLTENGAMDAGGIFVRAFFEAIPAYVQIDHTIIAFGVQGEAVLVDDMSGATLTCSDLFGNMGGDWVGAVETQLGADGNICLDPLFCDRTRDDYRLHEDSPCATDPGVCGLIGAFATGCASADAPETAGGLRRGEELRISPNPFRSSVEIGFTLEAPGDVVLRCFDVRGREVAVRRVESLEAGGHTLNWSPLPDRWLEREGSRAAPSGAGVYFLRVDTPEWTQIRKLLRVR